MTVTPCPDDCNFDWEKFHDDLDIAMAHVIGDAPHGAPAKEYFPSKFTGLDLAKYAQIKAKLRRDQNAK